MPGTFDPPAERSGNITGRRGLRRLQGPVYAHIVTDPERYEGFATITVGDTSADRSAREVQTTARLLSMGFPETQHTPVVLEDERGTTIGFITLRHGAIDCGRDWPEIDITAYGRDIGFRGMYLRDGTTSVGEALVMAGLEAVQLAFEGELMPRIWARVLADNEASHRALEQHMFRLRPPIVRQVDTPKGRVIRREDQVVRVRPRTIPLPPPLDPEVYVPASKPAEAFLQKRDPHKQFPRPSVGRNDPCVCGSELKFKRCCHDSWQTPDRGGVVTAVDARKS